MPSAPIKYSILHQHALKAVKQGHDRLALHTFQKAIGKTPKNITLLVDYAVYLKCLYRFEESLSLLERIGQLARDNSSVTRTLAKIAVECRAEEQAMKWLKKSPNDAACLFLLATSLERSGKLDEAELHLENAERIAGITVDSCLLKARLRMRQKEPEKSLDIITELLKKPPQKPQVLASLHYAKGTALDSLGDFSGAFQAWSEAKRLYLLLASATMESSQTHFDMDLACINRLTSAELGLWREWESPLENIQPIMLTGYPRSGTTLLEHSIEQRSAIPSADENGAFRDLVWRKLNIPSMDADKIWQSLNDKTLTDFDSDSPLKKYQNALGALTRDAENRGWIIDKNPQLLMKLPVFLRLVPRLPVLAIHRDPRDVMLSCFSQPFGLNAHSVHYLSMESLAAHLAQSRLAADKLKHVLGEQMVEVRYEKLVMEKDDHVDEVIRQLNVAAGSELSAHERPPENTSARVSYSPTYAEVSEPIHQKAVGRWKNYQQWIEPHLGHLEEWLTDD